MICKYCGSIYYTDNAAICPVCGEILIPTERSEMEFSSGDAFAARSLSAEREALVLTAPSADPGADEKSEPMPFGSLLAKLDRDERDIFSRFEEEPPAYTPESETGAAMWDAREDNLASLSTALDGLLTGLLGTAETDDARTPAPDACMAALPKRGRYLTASSFSIALVAAVFLLGVAAGFLVSDLLGL